MAITDTAGYTAAKASGKPAPIQKSSIANTAAGAIVSLWRATGLPTQGAIPAAAAVCTKALAGAIVSSQVIGGSNTSYIDGFALGATAAGTLHLFDRVIHSGGLNGTLTTAQAVNTPALPARAAAADCHWYIEHYADTGATAVNATVAVTYTDTTSANLVVAVPATQRASRCLPIIPAAGKIIASVQTLTLSATSGTAGNFGITCRQRLGVCAVVIAANLADRAQSLLRAMPAADACLELLMDTSTTSTGDVRGHLDMIAG
jgi:hypothetical protein